jgi:hypothetical protein
MLSRLVGDCQYEGVHSPFRFQACDPCQLPCPLLWPLRLWLTVLKHRGLCRGWLRQTELVEQNRFRSRLADLGETLMLIQVTPYPARFPHIGESKSGPATKMTERDRDGDVLCVGKLTRRRSFRPFTSFSSNIVRRSLREVGPANDPVSDTGSVRSLSRDSPLGKCRKQPQGEGRLLDDLSVRHFS